jgi:hypothetical protein
MEAHRAAPGGAVERRAPRRAPGVQEGRARGRRSSAGSKHVAPRPSVVLAPANVTTRRPRAAAASDARSRTAWARIALMRRPQIREAAARRRDSHIAPRTRVAITRSARTAARRTCNATNNRIVRPASPAATTGGAATTPASKAAVAPPPSAPPTEAVREILLAASFTTSAALQAMPPAARRPAFPRAHRAAGSWRAAAASCAAAAGRLITEMRLPVLGLAAKGAR